MDAIVAYIDDPEIDTLGLMEHIPGPDFPTGGIIYGHAGIQAAYHAGEGSASLCGPACTKREIRAGRMALIVTEIPYQVNKSTLVEKIASLVRDKRISGISDLRDESDRDGMRIVIELRKDAVAQVVENKLYKYSQCQADLRGEHGGSGRRAPAHADVEGYHSALRGTPARGRHAAYQAPPSQGERTWAHA